MSVAENILFSSAIKLYRLHSVCEAKEWLEYIKPGRSLALAVCS
jgi:hypothetical protein